MSIGFWQILLVVALVVLLFGRNKISDLMGDVAKGITSFKKGLAAGDEKDDKDGDKKLARDGDPEAGADGKESANG